MSNLTEEIHSLKKQIRTRLFVMGTLALSVTLLLVPTIFERMKDPNRDFTWVQGLDLLSGVLSFSLMIYLGIVVSSLKKRYRLLEEEYKETGT
jgi:hypothetical protein